MFAHVWGGHLRSMPIVLETDQAFSRQFILSAPVDDVDLTGVLAFISNHIHGDSHELQHIVTVNPEFVIAARHNPTFAQVLRESALATADGVGIVLAGRVLGVPVGPRVTGVELVEGIAELSARDEAARLFLLGAAEGVAAEAAARLRERYAGARIVGTYAGSPRDAEWPEIERRLAGAGATVLLVAFGHPAQDLWIAEHREALVSHGILVAIGVGGAFDYLSGRVPRAPRFIRQAGMEWLYRLIRQPWRWRRQLALPLFVLLVLRERVRRLTR